MLGVLFLAVDDDADGADDARALTAAFSDMLDQVRRGGFTVGARDTTKLKAWEGLS